MFFWDEKHEKSKQNSYKNPAIVEKIKLPELFADIESVYNAPDAKKENFKTGPLKNRPITRYAPPERYLLDKINDIKKYAALREQLATGGIMLGGWQKQSASRPER